MLCMNHKEILTCSRHEKAASRYFFTFLVHADDTKVKMALGVEGSSSEIALWQDLEIAPIAYNRVSLPCHIQLYDEPSYNRQNLL